MFALKWLIYTVDRELHWKKKSSEIVNETVCIAVLIPFLKTPSVNSTTSSSTPPPGARRSTFGTNPLYSAPGPSSRKIVKIAGYVQLYLGLTPGTLAVP